MPSQILLQLQVFTVQIDTHVITTSNNSLTTGFELDAVQITITNFGMSLFLGHALVPEEHHAIHVT